MDTVDSATRSRIMSVVGQKNTGPETLLRSALHRAGFRYRLHVRSLPGRPDLVFSRFKAVAFVHGCYWHSHGCYRSTVPKTRREFWEGKFRANRARDARNIDDLHERGWRVMVVWECALVGKQALTLGRIADTVHRWLDTTSDCLEISGVSPRVAVRDGREPISGSRCASHG